MITSVNSTSDSIKARPRIKASLNCRTGGRIAGHGFTSCSSYSSLTEAGQAGGYGDAKSRSNGDPVGASWCSSVSALRIRRHGHHRNGQQRKKYHHYFPHVFLLMNRCQWVVDVHRADALTLADLATSD